MVAYPAGTIGGVTVSGTPTAHQVVTALTGTTADWETPTAGIALDTTAGDIAALGAQAAGAVGKAADAGHVHPTTNLQLLNSAGGVPVAAGSAIAGANAGIDAAFANVFRVFNNYTSGVTQYVTGSGGAHNWYVNGVDVFDAAQTLLSSNVVHGFRAGTNTTGTAGAGAPILTAVAGTNGGAAVQLSDTNRDYMVYLQVGTTGTAWIVQMGHTSAGNDVTIHSTGAATAGQTLTFRLPGGWYFLWSATTATLAQSVAVGC